MDLDHFILEHPGYLPREGLIGHPGPFMARISPKAPSVTTKSWSMKTNLDKFVAIAEVLGEKVDSLSKLEATQAAVEAVKSLIGDLAFPLRLRDVGVQKEDFKEFTQVVLKRSSLLVSRNPRFLNEENLVKIYEMAW